MHDNMLKLHAYTGEDNMLKLHAYSGEDNMLKLRAYPGEEGEDNMLKLPFPGSRRASDPGAAPPGAPLATARAPRAAL